MRPSAIATGSAARSGAKRSTAAAWLAWSLAGGLALAAWLALGAGALAGSGPTCALREIAGIGCPTCGMTRALECLARGDLAASVRQHPLAAPFVLQAWVAWLAWGFALVSGIGGLADRWLPRVVAFDAAALVVVWLARLLTGASTP